MYALHELFTEITRCRDRACEIRTLPRAVCAIGRRDRLASVHPDVLMLPAPWVV